MCGNQKPGFKVLNVLDCLSARMLKSLDMDGCAQLVHGLPERVSYSCKTSTLTVVGVGLPTLLSSTYLLIVQRMQIHPKAMKKKYTKILLCFRS